LCDLVVAVDVAVVVESSLRGMVGVGLRRCFDCDIHLHKAEVEVAVEVDKVVEELRGMQLQDEGNQLV